MVLINKKIAPYIIGAIFLLLIDRFLKIWAFKFLVSDYFLLGDILKFSFAKNSGIAFSIPLSGPFLVILIVCILLILLWELRKHYIQEKFTVAGILLIIFSGAVSNLWDRIQYGFVIDYLDLKYFTVFNIADSMISVGVFLLILIVSKVNVSRR
jgi:signal peptidase II